MQPRRRSRDSSRIQRSTALAVQHVLARQQPAHLLHVLDHGAHRQRRHAHRVAAGEAGADAENRPARRQCVDGRDGARR
jgi:hypothetical protein